MAATDTEGDTAAAGARERILDASYELFSHRGIQGVGIDAIIDRSGVARQTLYRHFDSKQDLVLAFLERREDLWTKGWLQAEVQRRATDPARAPAGHLRRLRRLVSPQRLRGLLVHQRDARDARARATRSVARAPPTWPASATSSRGSRAPPGSPTPTTFARKWHILMKGSIIAAAEGDHDAARRAQEIGRAVLAAQG